TTAIMTSAQISVQIRMLEEIKSILNQVMDLEQIMILEQFIEEEMVAQLQARLRERTARRRGHRNGHHVRGFTTEAGHIEQIRVPRARELPFLTEVFERYRRMTGSMEEAVLEMYL